LLATTLASQGHQVAVLSFTQTALPTDLEDALRTGRVPLTCLNKRTGFDVSVYAGVHRTLREFEPDVVHTHQYVLPYVLPASLYHRVRAKVHTVNNGWEYEARQANRWVHHLAFRAGVVPVAVGEEVANVLCRALRLRAVTVIPSAVSVQAYRAAAAARDVWRRREGFSKEDVLFVCVAGFRPEKNHALLLQAFAQGALHRGAAHLLLVGVGALREVLQDRVRDLGLGDSVRFLGFRTDLAEVLAAADVFVLPSDREGNPLAVLEAMAAGTPIIATAVGGLPELVESGLSGLLVPPGDAAALTTALRRIYEDSALRGALGANSLRRAEERFDISVAAREYTKLYESLVSKRASFRIAR